MKHITHHQRALSRKKKGSANREKERRRVRELYGRLKQIRHDYIHKGTRAIVNMKPRVIVIESLNISGMMKNKHLARAVAEQNLYLFRLLLEYKAQAMGINIKHADMFYPSSKTCSHCGHVREKLRLDERVYKCPECGLEINRDLTLRKI